MRLSAAGGLDYNFGQRRSVRTADPRVSPRSVGPAVRTNDLAASAVAGIMIKARTATLPAAAQTLYHDLKDHLARFDNPAADRLLAPLLSTTTPQDPDRER